MRDALTIFDKIASSVGDTITYKDVVSNLNLLDYEYYFKVTDSILREDISEVLITLNEIVKQGFDPEHFIVGLADHFRDLLIAKSPSTLSILEASDDLKLRYKNQATLSKSSFLLSALNILNKCDIDLVRAKNKRLQVEIALSKLTFLNRATEIEIFGVHTGSQEKKTELLNENRSAASENSPSALASDSESSPSDKIISYSDLQHQDSKIILKNDIPILEKQSSVLSGIKMTDIASIKANIKQSEIEKAEARKSIWLIN